jgi:hypothetical protein
MRTGFIKQNLTFEKSQELKEQPDDELMNTWTRSMTLLCMSQRRQWHRCACQSLHCACHSGVNDTAVHVTAVSMTPLCSQLCWIFSQIIVNTVFMQTFESAAQGTSVSLTPLWHAKYMGVSYSTGKDLFCHSGIIDTAVTKIGDFLRECEAIFKKALSPCTLSEKYGVFYGIDCVRHK